MRAPCKHIFCPYIHHRSLGKKVKTFFLLKVVMLYIKSKGMEHRAPCKHKFCPYTHPQSPDGAKRSNISYLNVVMLHIKLNGDWKLEHYASTYIHP